jgi:hypothetical protein
MNSLPENVNYGNPNEYPTNFPTVKNENKETLKKSDNKSSDTNTNDKIIAFLKTNVTTILTLAIAVAIGFGIKDFLNSMVMNVLQPSMLSLILMIDKNNYLPLTASLREKEIQIDISKFLGSLLVLKLIVGTTYLIYNYTNVLSPVKFI